MPIVHKTCPLSCDMPLTCEGGGVVECRKCGVLDDCPGCENCEPELMPQDILDAMNAVACSGLE